MPKASIVIPCYNAASFVAETVASAQAQTIDDLQIVCVNDGSSDQTLKILEELAANDQRILVIDQKNAGEGPARDAGLEAATGDWLYFLDADDLMEPTLLEAAIAVGERDSSDIVVFQTMLHDNRTGGEELCWFSFRTDLIAGPHFRPMEQPEHLFNSFQNWVHNKLFRASYVHAHNLRFQHVHRTADLLFTCRALAEADRISLLEEALHHYRVNNPESALATSDSYPLDFFEGFLALRASLEEHDTWELYHDSFVSWAMDGVVTNLRLARSYEGFTTIANRMLDGGLAELDIIGFPREKLEKPVLYDIIQTLVNDSKEAALFKIMCTYRTKLEIAEGQIMLGNNVIGCLEGSVSYRVGRALTAPSRALRDKLEEHGGANTQELLASMRQRMGR